MERRTKKRLSGGGQLGEDVIHDGCVLGLGAEQDQLSSTDEAAVASGRPSASRELKAKKLLKRKTFRQAALRPPVAEPARRDLARQCLDDGAHATPEMITSLAQAKIAFAQDVLQACARYRARVFATMVPRGAPRSAAGGLRKDYAYLFERFSYFLEDGGGDEQGIVVVDELERSRSHVLIDQMRRYFIETRKGQRRAAWIIPEPFFVHSGSASSKHGRHSPGSASRASSHCGLAAAGLRSGPGTTRRPIPPRSTATSRAA